MSNEEEMLLAIKNFHKVYYEGDGSQEAMLDLHHAAEHLFNAAGITTSSCEDGENEEFIEAAKAGLEPPEDLKQAWERIRKLDI